MRQVVRASTVKFNKRDNPTNPLENPEDNLSVYFMDLTVDKVEKVTRMVRILIPGKEEEKPALPTDNPEDNNRS